MAYPTTDTHARDRRVGQGQSTQTQTSSPPGPGQA